MPINAMWTAGMRMECPLSGCVVNMYDDGAGSPTHQQQPNFQGPLACNWRVETGRWRLEWSLGTKELCIHCRCLSDARYQMVTLRRIRDSPLPANAITMARPPRIEQSSSIPSFELEDTMLLLISDVTFKLFHAAPGTPSVSRCSGRITGNLDAVRPGTGPPRYLSLHSTD